jgi:hypothetical protein
MRHQVRDPQGNLHIIEGPENATPEEVIAAAQKVIPQKTGIDDTRKQLGSGYSMRFGPWDTGIPLPQWGTEALAGAGRRAMDIVTLGNREGSETGDKALDASVPAMLGGAGTDLATLLGGGALLRGASTLPQLAKAAPALRAVGQNMMAPTSVRNAAVTAGAYGAATQSGGIEERAKAGLTQGVFGAAGQALPMAVGGVLKPRIAADNADLLNRGIRLTPGQMAGGALNQMESKATSLPIVGDAIAGARRRSVEDFNRAVADEVLKPFGIKSTKPAGRELINEVDSIVGGVYDGVLPRLTATFNNGTNNAINAGRQIAAESGKASQFDEIVKNRVLSRFDPNYNMTGEVFKEADSSLARLVRENRSSPDNNNRALARALDEVRKGLRSDVKGAPDDIAKLRQADAAYARLVRMETAAGMRAAKDGIFTPAQFGNATERGASRSAKASGTELMGKFADDAERVIGSSYPDSGTAGRALLGGGLLGYLDPSYLAASLGAAAAYTRPGQALLRGAATARPQALEAPANFARSLAPYGGLLAPQLFPVYSGQ